MKTMLLGSVLVLMLGAAEARADENPSEDWMNTDTSGAGTTTEGIGTPDAPATEAAPPAETESSGTGTFTDEGGDDSDFDFSAESGPSAEWLIGIAPRVGLAIPSSKLGLMAMGGLAIDFALPFADYRPYVGLDVSYTRPGHEGSGNDPRVGGDFDFELSEDILAFALDLGFRFFDNSETLVPWAELGPALVLLQTSESSSFAPDVSEQSTAFGVAVAAGLDFRLGPGFLFGDLRFTWAGLDHKLTGESNAGIFAIAAGYRLVF